MLTSRNLLFALLALISFLGYLQSRGSTSEDPVSESNSQTSRFSTEEGKPTRSSAKLREGSPRRGRGERGERARPIELRFGLSGVTVPNLGEAGWECISLHTFLQGPSLPKGYRMRRGTPPPKRDLFELHRRGKHDFEEVFLARVHPRGNLRVRVVSLLVPLDSRGDVISGTVVVAAGERDFDLGKITAGHHWVPATVQAPVTRLLGLASREVSSIWVAFTTHDQAEEFERPESSSAQLPLLPGEDFLDIHRAPSWLVLSTTIPRSNPSELLSLEPNDGSPWVSLAGRSRLWFSATTLFPEIRVHDPLGWQPEVRVLCRVPDVEKRGVAETILGEALGVADGSALSWSVLSEPQRLSQLNRAEARECRYEIHERGYEAQSIEGELGDAAPLDVSLVPLQPGSAWTLFASIDVLDWGDRQGQIPLPVQVVYRRGPSAQSIEMETLTTSTGGVEPELINPPLDEFAELTIRLDTPRLRRALATVLRGQGHSLKFGDPVTDGQRGPRRGKFSPEARTAEAVQVMSELNVRLSSGVVSLVDLLGESERNMSAYLRALKR